MTDASNPNERPKHPLDSLVADPTGLPPMCEPDRFADVLSNYVADMAPRLFAIVEV